MKKNLLHQNNHNKRKKKELSVEYYDEIFSIFHVD